MKQRLIRIFAITIMAGSLVMNAKAQTMQPKTPLQTPDNFIGVTGGLSAPFGNFTKTDFSDPKSGFAGTGYNLGITGTWFIKKNFGITALVSYHSYSFKGLQTLADSFKEAFAIDSSTINVKGSNYSLNFLVGPYYTIPIGKNFSFDTRLLVGFVSAHLAGNQLYFEDQAASTFTQQEATASTFGFQLGAGIKYHFSQHFGLLLNVDYFYSKPDFSISYDNRNNNAGRWIKNYNQPIEGINANLTLAYFLKQK